ncbi:MAG: L-fucose:H+ symporter permease [Cyclobacteriaceae bacterium]
MSNTQKTPLIPFILITSLFLLWGLANNMTDTLLAAFKKIMSMTDAQTSHIQLAFYGSYFCLALPAAILIKKYSYKTGILLGLGMFAVGALLFYPASHTMVYGHFLAALFILAGGLSILETTANPYIIAIGSEETGTRRLNFAQSFNPIGSLLGVFLSKTFILSQLNVASAEERATMPAEELFATQSAELEAVMGPYVSIAIILILLWVIIYFYNMPTASDEDKSINLMPSIKRLMQKSHYVSGVVAQFFYVGAQIGVWSYTIRYVMVELNLDEDNASDYYMVALGVFMAFRFVSTFLMKFLSPARLLAGASIMAIFLTLMVMYGEGYTGVYALVAISACMSLMFPTIYGMSIRGLGEDTKIGASGLIMAILGGAVLTFIQGQVSDETGSIHFSFVVPMLCFVIILLYAIVGKRWRIQENQ